MTNKTIVFGSVVTPMAAVVLAIMTWPGAVNSFASIYQARADHSVSAGPEPAGMPAPQLSRVRLVVSRLN